MSQTFQLQLATDNLALDAQQLGVSIEQLLAIRITVSATLLQPSQLYLSYQVRVPSSFLAEQLNWPQWQPNQVEFTDYLWEQTCLECFIAGDVESTTANGQNKVKNQASYIEINASPSGRYALYQFENYRQPSSLPPMPLYKADSNIRAYINWAVDSATQLKPSTPNLNPDIITEPIATINPATSNSNAHHYYKRSLTIPLNELPPFANGIKQLHPCVILCFDKVALYFAPIHASPPDFHQQQYWTCFNP